MRIRAARLSAAFVGAVLVGGVLTAPSALANPAGSGLVINEVYLNGGSSGATYLNKFVELGNPTPTPITLDGLSLQYRATGATSVFGQVQPLDGTVPAGGTYLIQLPANSTDGAALPDPDAVFTLNPSGTAGAIALAVGAAPLAGVDGNVTANPAVIDLVGWGTAAKSYETAVVPAGLNGVTASLNRTGFADTDSNAADFTAAAPTPTPSGGTEPEPDPEPVDATIAEIQGTGDASPLVGRLVTTTGVVTAAYPTGGFNGFYLQTGGSGGDPADDATPGASDGVFVFGSAVTQTVHIGDSLQVTGTVSEFGGLTEITPAATGDVVAIDTLPLVKSTEIDLPQPLSAREALEGMLHPAGTYTVTDVFSLNNFASIGLAFGDTPLKVPTEVAAPGPDADAVAADNAAHKVVLDDGSSVNYLGTGTGAANKNIPLPWLTDLGPIRVGYAATFTGDVIFDYRNAGWNFQPVAQLTAGDVNGVRPVIFVGERPAAPEPVGGDIKLGTFNVLNYFTTTGAAYEAANPGIDCTSFDDRAGNPIGVNSCTGDAGPRGAWDDASLARQQVKIVKAINELGADVVSLEEIENSAKFGIDRDTALAALVAALNAAAGAGTWDYVRSPAAVGLPPLDQQDVIRTGFIYKPAVVTPAGGSTVLTGSAAFADAREPLAQAFTPVAGRASDTFLVIVNHFKSKGSGVDDHTGQGLANPDRIAQAHALVAFADAMTTTYGTDRVFLTGDFNAYSKEDPVQVLTDAGYLDLEGQSDKETYSFGGESGSLDHVFASPTVQPSVTGLDVWQINGEESIAYEYSRYNYNATLFYADDVYRASDHDPVVLGLDVQAPLIASTTAASVAPVSYGTAPAVSVTVTAAGTTPTGTVTVSANGQSLGSASLSGGAATVSLPADLTPGSYPLVVSYEGSDTVAASETSAQLEVHALPSVVVAVAIPPIVRSGQGTTVYAVAATNAGAASGGTAQVYLNGTQLAAAPVGSGVARVPLPAFNSRGLKLLTVSYTGTDTVAGSATVVLVLVR